MSMKHQLILGRNTPFVESYSTRLGLWFGSSSQSPEKLEAEYLKDYVIPQILSSVKDTCVGWLRY